jgi:hypothetical protein
MSGGPVSCLCLGADAAAVEGAVAMKCFAIELDDRTVALHGSLASGTAARIAARSLGDRGRRQPMESHRVPPESDVTSGVRPELHGEKSGTSVWIGQKRHARLLRPSNVALVHATPPPGRQNGPSKRLAGRCGRSLASSVLGGRLLGPPLASRSRGHRPRRPGGLGNTTQIAVLGRTLRTLFVIIARSR